MVWERHSLEHEQALEAKVGELFYPARDAKGTTAPQLQGMRATKFEQDSQVTYTTVWGKVKQGLSSAVPAKAALVGDDDGARDRDEAVVVADDGEEGQVVGEGGSG